MGNTSATPLSAFVRVVREHSHHARQHEKRLLAALKERRGAYRDALRRAHEAIEREYTEHVKRHDRSQGEPRPWLKWLADHALEIVQMVVMILLTVFLDEPI